MTEKHHAKDYLLEFAANANTSGWLRDLIIRTVVSNGDLSEEDLAQTAEKLKANAASSLTMPAGDTGDTATVIRLTKLIHHNGVNALAAEQTIAFSPDVTLLYGHNGTGKSGYFRVLNEIVGGSRQLPVYGDVFSASQSPVNVELQYTMNGTPQTLHWNNEGRAIAPLTQTSVFDSGYTQLLLNRRSADSAIVRPMGLHLFTALTTAMDSIKARLAAESDVVRRSLPQIRQDNLSQEVRNVLNQVDFSAVQKRSVVSHYEMSEALQRKLDDCETAYKQLSAANYDDKIKLVQSERATVNTVYEHIGEAHKQLYEAEKQLAQLNVLLKEAETEAEKARKKIAILDEIGLTDSDEWRMFITAGDSFITNSDIKQGICPYCRQSLGDHAGHILKAYSDYLADTSQKTLKDRQDQKSRLLRKIQGIAVVLHYPTQLEQILGEELMAIVKEELTSLTVCKTALEEDKAAAILPVPPVLDKLKAIIDGFDRQVEKFKRQKSTQQEQLKTLNETRLGLLEHKAIAEQKIQFEDWFSKVEQIREYTRWQGKLSTRSISNLSKTAGQQLVTETLRERFQEELDALKMGHLKVSLGEEGARSGQSYMRIKLPVDYSTKEILSEGEQKSVALALFLAERRMQPTGNPIILDDPVNSLDHRIIALLMERLIQLGNQIIIFSHNILLRDSLLALHSVHECNEQEINGCHKQNKHLYLYNVSVRKQRKGNIRSSKQDNARYIIEEARRVLGKNDYNDDVDGKVCAELLREAIERLVDEKVFKNLVPIRYRGGKNQAIHWDQLKTLQADSHQVDLLKSYYNRLSGGGLHLGGEQQENPVDWNELNEIAVNLFAEL